jgi:hypothetical protein
MRAPALLARAGRLGQRRFDSQPGQAAAVLIVTPGLPVPADVLRGARRRGEGPVAVLSLARVHGSAWGLPNPGLLPTAKELAEHRQLVTRAVRRLEEAGTEAYGQVAVTRRPVKTIVTVARARRASHVMVLTPPTPRWRAIIEGDLALDVGRRLPDGMSAEPVPVPAR